MGALLHRKRPRGRTPGYTRHYHLSSPVSVEEKGSLSVLTESKDWGFNLMWLTVPYVRRLDFLSLTPFSLYSSLKYTRSELLVLGPRI